jgi:peptidoglycan/xylan/chitin deacetylase (PgdA/CDA1 family)
MKEINQITSMNIHDMIRQDPEIWDLFTRKEEYTNPLRDCYDRFPYYASKNRDIFEPIVSQYLVEHGYSIEYPDGAPFAVCLTHDIDTIYQSLFSKGLNACRAFRKQDYSRTITTIGQMRSRKIPLYNFSAIMDLEEKYDAKSTFFFMAENPGEQDYSYDVEDIGPEIGNIVDQGWEVGLHGGHGTYLDPRHMRQKKERLEKVTGKPVLGYRNHYLRFRVPDTWEYLSQAGFAYDATFGYADCVGFRNGMCHPFKPYNLNTNREIDIVEIPLAIMDGTLFNYMRMDTGKAWDMIKRLIDTIEKYHGVLTILWHNTYMEGENLELYEKILNYCGNRKAWMTNSGDLILR